MKKIAILGLCLMVTASAFAQKSVVKEAESAMKSGKPYTEVKKIITPAYSNPETQNTAEVYYIPGKAGIQQYDDMLGKRQLNMLPNGEADFIVMDDALMAAYGDFMKALPLDSLPDAKGKIKPKYSKDIINKIAGHVNDYNMMGGDYWNSKEYDKAYQTWQIYLDILNDPRFEGKVNNPGDTIIAGVYYNQALAAWQSEDLNKAIDAFRKSINKGNNKEEVLKYAVGVANLAKDNDALLEFASMGNNLYGKEDTEFLNQIINYYLQTEKYDEAMKYLSNGISTDPSNSQYYALRGIIYDNKNDRDNAMADYKKALDLNPENSLALFYYGRGVAAKAGELQDNYDKPDYDSYKAKNIDPQYREAVSYLEKAYTLDPNNRTEILRVLDICYYNLNDAAGQESVKERQLGD